jgi:hypothetical protein
LKRWKKQASRCRNRFPVASLETSCSVLRDESLKVRRSNAALQAEATDSELGPDDIIVRYRGDELIRLTVIHASRRSRRRGKSNCQPNRVNESLKTSTLDRDQWIAVWPEKNIGFWEALP